MQLDWPAIALWSYASMIAVDVWFQNKGQSWILHQTCYFFILRRIKNELARIFFVVLAILAKIDGFLIIKTLSD